MLEERKTLYIKDKNGQELIIDVLTILPIDGIDYIVYSIDKDVDTSDVYVARIIKDHNENDVLVTIENEAERQKVFSVIDKMINES